MQILANPNLFMRIARKVIPWAWALTILCLGAGLYLGLLDSPADPGFAYFLFASTGLGPIALDLREIRLTFDPLVQLILTEPLPFFSGFSGTLDAVGQTTAPVFAIPNLAWLAGQTLHFAMLTADPWGMSPSGINTISDTVTVVIQ